MRRNTSDAADSGAITVAGGGAAGTTRGADLSVYGNEHSTRPGDVVVTLGTIGGGQFSVVGNASTTTSISLFDSPTSGIYAGDFFGNGWDGDIVRFRDSDGTCLASPEAGAMNWGCASDAKLKTNIVDAPSILGALRALRVRQYGTVASPTKRLLGSVAQEVQAVDPARVRVIDGELYVTVPTVWELLKAIQELAAQVEALERRVP